MTTALYPGSFDPLTSGHLDIVTRASKLFGQLIIAVYDTPDKRLLFTTKERVELAQVATAHLPNVKATSYTGLTVDFARKTGANVIVRGLRMSSDFEHEFEMALMNKKLAPDLELVCLMSSLQYQFVSSSLLKELAQLGARLDGLVPANVATALTQKLRTTC
ncbi:MAG: pantetheine-phosphate adenylyltransferase [Chloroflexi bacterium]|nr:pantetheine-phosphate adenylyltransferase [Chloroflexota bacterium]